MTDRLDLSGALRFDLARGRVSAAGAGPRVVLPVDALAHVCRALPREEITAFGRGLGNEVGRRLGERLGGSLGAVSTGQMVEHLGGELALMGLGSLSVEIWGRALVLAVVDSPFVFGSGGRMDLGDQLLGAVIEGALLRATSRELEVVPLARIDDSVRFLVCSGPAKTRIEGWLSAGSHYGEALARLNELGGAA